MTDEKWMEKKLESVCELTKSKIRDPGRNVILAAISFIVPFIRIFA